MDDEVEDIVGDVQYTDSQKSVTTSAAYSLDFTDSSPERHNSSGKQTYVLERDDSDDSESTFRINRDQSLINLNEAMSPQPDMQQLLYDEINKSVRANFRRHTLTHEFTQTSRTIIELAQTEVFVVHKPNQTNSLETQTSFVSLTKRKMDYKTVKVNDCIPHKNEVIHNVTKDMNDIKKLFLQQSPDMDTNEQIVSKIQSAHNNTTEQIVTEEHSVSTYEEPELTDREYQTGLNSEHSSEDRIITFIDDESKESEDQKEANETTSELESSKYDSDIDEDSLMETEYRSNRRSKGDNTSDTSEMQKSIDNDVDELYSKLSESPLWRSPEINIEPCAIKFGTLTPLSEETSVKKSCLDMTTSSQTLMAPTKDNETIYVHNDSVKVKIFSNSGDDRENVKLKLPPIPNKSCPNSPHLNFLFTVNTNPRSQVKAGTLPYLFEGRNVASWQDGAKVLASGESPLITGRSDPVKTPRDPVYLPPIHMEGAIYHNTNKPTSFVSPHQTIPSPATMLDAISIGGKIRELKTMTNNKTRSRAENRNSSPAGNSSRPERLYDVAERGCDNLCLELLRKLRSPSWVEVVETLEDLPRSLEKYWTVVTVNRTAEMLRQVMVHIDSPRTQVARSACNVLAEILKNTNFTRKPDFYESISALLTKTGSFSRPVRRAANVALDDIACGVDVTHAATAVCVYGVGHKSALVRCASARLLVVCCALAEGGRQILRARPPTAAAARRHVLRALAELLQDKNVDTRKYAERLYIILRPLPTFEAYFLTDVDVELAARQMKKYDPMLVPSKRDSATSLSIFS